MVAASIGNLISLMLLAAAMLLFVPDIAFAHTPHDNIIQVIVSPDYRVDRTVFAISRNRVLRSTNAGEEWNEIVNGVDRDSPVRLVFAPSDEHIMYMSNLGGGVYRSDDQGLSWQRTKTPSSMSQVAELAVSSNSPNVVYAAGRTAGLFRTTDGGQSWTAVGSFQRVTALLFPDTTARVVVAESNGRIFVSDNNGGTWTQSGGTANGDMITALAATSFPATGATVFAGTQSGRLLRSTNRGTSFSVVGSGLPVEQITSIGISAAYPTDATMWVSTWKGGVYWSGNRGVSFSRRSEGLTTDGQAVSLGQPQFSSIAVAVATSGEPVVFVGGFDGLFRSDNRGGLWRHFETFSEYIVGLDVSPDYTRDRTVISTTYVKGAYLSNDRGSTWMERHPPLGSGTKFSRLPRLHNVHFSPNYANDRTIFSATWTDVLKSSDRGVSWIKIPVGTPPPKTLRQFVLALSPSYASDRTVFVGTRTGEVYRSKAGGAADTWSLLANLGGRIRSIVVSPAFAVEPVLYASTEQGAFKSVDGGTNWQAVGRPGISLLAISPNYSADGTVYAATERGLFVTRNAGQSWTELIAAPLSTSTHVEAIGVSPAYATDRTVLVSVLGKGLFRSTNGGTTFVETGSGLINGSALIADFDHPTSAPIQFSPSYATDRTIFGFAQTHIVKSTDRGDTWRVLDLPPAVNVQGSH